MTHAGSYRTSAYVRYDPRSILDSYLRMVQKGVCGLVVSTPFSVHCGGLSVPHFVDVHSRSCVERIDMDAHADVSSPATRQVLSTLRAFRWCFTRLLFSASSFYILDVPSFDIALVKLF